MLIRKHDHSTPTREIRRHVRPLARHHPEGWKLHGGKLETGRQEKRKAREEPFVETNIKARPRGNADTSSFESVKLQGPLVKQGVLVKLDVERLR